MSCNVTLAMDDEGQVVSRSWADGRQQNLTWDAAGRLTQVIEFKVPLAGDSESAYAFRWSAVYDGLGRRCVTRTEWGAWGAGGFTADAERAVVLEESGFDPLVEFLEIVTEVRELGNPAAARRSWRVHGPDANGSYGGLQGLGGLEAVYSHGAAAVASGSWSAVIDDYYGHVIATVEGTAEAQSVVWQRTRSLGYGPAPDSPVWTLSDGASLEQAAEFIPVDLEKLPACSSHRARFVALKNAARFGLCCLAVFVGLKIVPGKMSMPGVILFCDFQQIQGAQQMGY